MFLFKSFTTVRCTIGRNQLLPLQIWPSDPFFTGFMVCVEKNLNSFRNVWQVAVRLNEFSKTAYKKRPLLLHPSVITLLGQYSSSWPTPLRSSGPIHQRLQNTKRKIITLHLSIISLCFPRPTGVTPNECVPFLPNWKSILMWFSILMHLLRQDLMKFCPSLYTFGEYLYAVKEVMLFEKDWLAPASTICNDFIVPYHNSWCSHRFLKTSYLTFLHVAVPALLGFLLCTLWEPNLVAPAWSMVYRK